MKNYQTPDDVCTCGSDCKCGETCKCGVKHK